ncbi:MAG: NADH-quinone oxidoreductase subunit N, partial [Bacillus sp. (in: firmicutes)]
SYFYYFGVMTQMFFRPAGDDGKFKLPVGIIVVLVVAVAGSLLFGVMPNIAFDFMQNNLNNLADFFS